MTWVKCHIQRLPEAQKLRLETLRRAMKMGGGLNRLPKMEAVIALAVEAGEEGINKKIDDLLSQGVQRMKND